MEKRVKNAVSKTETLRMTYQAVTPSILVFHPFQILAERHIQYRRLEQRLLSFEAWHLILNFSQSPELVKKFVKIPIPFPDCSETAFSQKN